MSFTLLNKKNREMAKNGLFLISFLSFILFLQMTILGGATTTHDHRKASMDLRSSALVALNFLMINEHIHIVLQIFFGAEIALYKLLIWPLQWCKGVQSSECRCPQLRIILNLQTIYTCYLLFRLKNNYKWCRSILSTWGHSLEGNMKHHHSIRVFCKKLLRAGSIS